MGLCQLQRLSQVGSVLNSKVRSAKKIEDYPFADYDDDDDDLDVLAITKNIPPAIAVLQGGQLFRRERGPRLPEHYLLVFFWCHFKLFFLAKTFC